MAIRDRLVAAVLALLCGACAQGPVQEAAGVQRMYVFNCGESRTTDVSRWSPGVNVGQPFEFSANCYLIRHARGLMMWDAGIPDRVVDMPQGLVTGGGSLTYRLPRTLLQQMTEIGVAPSQVTHVAFSHTHGDHVGNANYFRMATLYMQEAEYDAAFGPDAARKFNFQQENYGRLRSNVTVKLRGDHDVFGDGSVQIVATPGHTPGHQSLLVRLPKTGPVLLTGDMTHFQDNWVNRRVPAMNFNRDQSVQSMQKVADLVAKTGAQLWINHDKAQSARIPRAPAFVE